MCKSPKQGLLFIAFCGALLLVGLFFIDPSTSRNHGGSLTLRGGDRAMLELVLDKYKVLARNVTLRVESLERAVLDLREGAHKSRHRPKHGDNGDHEHHEEVPHHGEVPHQEGDKEGAADKDPDANLPPEEAPAEAPFPFNDEPEETEEERAKRQEAEEKLQKEMIFFNQSTGQYLRYRTDSKCGSQVPPLPDGEMVECPPGFDQPCCSALGWCGRLGDHCKCEMCSDYRYKANVTFLGMKLKKAKRECETIAADLGPFSTPEECARTAANDGECGKMIMFSFNYPNWGCRCCAIDTPEGDEEKDAWNVYAYEVKVGVLPQVPG